MNKARERFEKETKDMTLQEKIVWVKQILFYIEIDDYIKDKRTHEQYVDIKRELESQLQQNG